MVADKAQHFLVVHQLLPIAAGHQHNIKDALNPPEGDSCLVRPAAALELPSMCECGRRTSRRICPIADVHGCDETGFHSEYVENLAVG